MRELLTRESRMISSFPHESAAGSGSRPPDHQPMCVRPLSDKNEIVNFLETDRLYAGYALGDLEPALFEQCEWAGAECNGRLCGLTLVFKGLDPPALFLMGEPGALASTLRSASFPRRAYVTCQQHHLPAVQALYHTEAPTPMWRVSIQRDDFRPVYTHEVSALSIQHLDALMQLYGEVGVDAFTPTQLANGVFYGVFVRRRLVAAAGTHLVSLTYGTAAVGNVCTDAAYRGRGYGTATTSAVVGELFRRGLTDVILNVAQANATAIRIYERLGFTQYCPFLEMVADKKN